MAIPFNGDLVPTTSGHANLGVNVGPNAQNAFDASTIRPFNHIHMISGVFHDPLYGQSGIIRFNQVAGDFQVSVDGGLTFVDLAAGSAGGVTDIGVLGDTNLTGSVDLASAASSGFIAIFDTANASPIQFAVDQLGLSGLWDFPTQGFNGSVVNELTDFHGTTAQGPISVVGASGIIVDIVGQTMTIASNTDVGSVARCYTESFGASTTWSVNHALNTTNVSIQTFDAQGTPNLLFADSTVITDANNVTITFNVAQAGQVIVLGC